MPENGGSASAAASCVEDCIHPVPSSGLPCRALPHRGAALCGSTRCWQSGFIKVPHCCPSSLRCMWTNIIGRAVSVTFKPGRHEKKNPGSDQEIAKQRYVPACPGRCGFCCTWGRQLGSVCVYLRCFCVARRAGFSAHSWWRRRDVTESNVKIWSDPVQWWTQALWGAGAEIYKGHQGHAGWAPACTKSWCIYGETVQKTLVKIQYYVTPTPLW